MKGADGGTGDDACDIMGPALIVIQALLGVLALSSLIYKRSKEYPIRRPWKIWFYDVSKQVFGALGVHMLNILMSILKGQKSSLFDMFFLLNITGDDDTDNDPLDDPCNYYFLNILFDTTIGVPILYVCLVAIYKVVNYFQVQGVQSGEYGNPPRVSNYLKQLVIYIIGLILMKIIIYLALIYFPILLFFADWILSVFNKNDFLQLVFVLMGFPLVMNSLQYYLIDNIIQSPEYKNIEYGNDKKVRIEPGLGANVSPSARPAQQVIDEVTSYGSIEE